MSDHLTEKGRLFITVGPRPMQFGNVERKDFEWAVAAGFYRRGDTVVSLNGAVWDWIPNEKIGPVADFPDDTGPVVHLGT